MCGAALLTAGSWRRRRKSGAELLDGTAAIACEEENGAVWVTLQNRERCKVRARYLLDCEGVTGRAETEAGAGPGAVYHNVSNL